MAGDKPSLIEGRREQLALTAAGAALVCYAAACKALLFRDLEYTGSDLYGILDQSRSWLFTGRLLQDNAYGDQAAIHNYYLLPVLSPLTLWLGAYGLILVLALLELLAVMRLATSRALDTPGRLAALAGLLSPLAFFALDDPLWGFHPELLYPSLAVLLALALLERRRGQAVFIAVVTILVKEDGALVCGSVLAAYYARRLWLARSATRGERRRVALGAAAVLGATAAAFVLGLVLLWWLGRTTPVDQSTFGGRMDRAWGILARTVGPGAPEGRRAALVDLLAGYAAAALVLMLPLGARAVRGLLLFVVSAPPILVVLVVSGAHYKFVDPLWAQRVATLLAVVLACIALAGAGWEGDRGTTRLRSDAREPAPARGWSVTWALSLGVLSWALQLGLLAHGGYSLAPRIDARALWSGRGYALSALPGGEVRFWRCVAGRLPVGMPVSPVAELYPFFHRQSIVFQSLEVHAPRPARLRVTRAAGAASGAVGTVGAQGSVEATGRSMCPGPQLRDLTLEADCDLQPLLAPCGWAAARADAPMPREGVGR
jgi:hypothetical protein